MDIKNDKLYHGFLTTSAVLLIVLSTYICYSVIFEFNSPYKNTIKGYIAAVNSINQKVFTPLSNGQTIDMNQLKKTLPSSINDLVNLKNSLQKSNPPSQYKEDYENFVKGVDNNILIFKQTLSVLNNMQADDISVSLKNIAKYKTNCNKYYKLHNSYGNYITLNNISYNLVEDLTLYTSSMKQIKNNNDIITSQNEDFQNNINNLYTKFSQIETNFSSYAQNVRKSSISIDSAQSEIIKNKSQLIKIKNDFSQITVPDKGIQCYEAFSTLLDDYGDYLDSFSSGLDNEKASTDKKIIDMLYSDSATKYNYVNKDLKTFLSFFDDFKKVK